MTTKRKKLIKRGSAPQTSSRGRGKGGRGGRRGGGSTRKPGRSKDSTSLDFIPLTTSSSPLRSKKKLQRLSGKRVLREERDPLRYQPVEFVRADEAYDPSVVIEKMMRDPLEGEVDPEVLILESDEQDNERRMRQLELAASQIGDVSPQRTPTLSGDQMGSDLDAVFEDTNCPRELNMERKLDEELSVDEIHLDAISLDSSTADPIKESDESDAIAFSKREVSDVLSENDSSDEDAVDSDRRNSPSTSEDFIDSPGRSDNESLGSEMDDFDEADMSLLQRFAMRDFEGYGSDVFDESDGMESDEADDLIQQLIEGTVDFSSYEVPATRKRTTKKTSVRRKERRKARELERLTNFGKDPELWQKYPERISIQDVLQEISCFSLSDPLQEIRFPPLDHNANNYVKEIARLHGLTTYMQGRATLKCVVVARTSRTGPVRDFAKLRSLLSRRQLFTRVDLNVGKDNSRQKNARNSARVRDGQIVGHQAESISSDSFGHRLMTMMGWKEGTGLGMNNAGITAPISAKVKLTKVGIIGTQEKTTP